MQGSGKQQERQHAVHQRLVKVDRADKRGDRLVEAEGGDERVESDHEQRARERDDQRAARGRQLQNFVIHEA